MASAVHKKNTESKYVTCFVDSRPDVDVTFRDVLLNRPTDHYLVGVDNFSMTNTSLSMIEPMSGNNSALIRIVRRLKPTDGAVLTTTSQELDNVFSATNGIDLEDLIVGDNNYQFEISSNETILSVQQLMHRLEEVASDVSLYMNSGLAVDGPNGNYEYGGFTAEVGSDLRHLTFDLALDGRLRIEGTAAFWSCFCVEVPALRNQFGFYGDRTSRPDTDFTGQRRFLAFNPATAQPTFAKIQVNTKKRTIPPFPVQTSTDTTLEFAARILTWGNVKDEYNAFNTRTTQGGAPECNIVADVLSADAQGRFNIYTGQDHNKLYSYTTQASLFSSLERRVSLEVGCSLPIKNSPMVDHQKESPDFVMGRWIWRTDPRIESNDFGGSRRYQSAMPACTEYQGARDRITYHELQAQAKIQTLRVKLFARIRTFNEKDETYGMRIVELPTSSTDWWHVRLHFMSKD